MSNVQFVLKNGLIFTFRPGEIESIECNINSNLDFDAMPGSTSTGAFLLDVNGVLKTIEISGELFSDGTNCLSGPGAGSIISINEQRMFLEKILNGFQEGLTFISNYSSSFNGNIFINSKVLISSFRYKEIRGNPEVLPFTISLIVGEV